MKKNTETKETKKTAEKPAAKKTVKKVKKQKPVIDFTNITCIDEIDTAIVAAKLEYGMKLSESDFDTIIYDAINGLFGPYNAVVREGNQFVRVNVQKFVIGDNQEVVTDGNGSKCKKKGFFKRLWNKLF